MATVFDADRTQIHHSLHAFCFRPDVRFEEQQDGEEVILVLRAHPITQLHWVVVAIVLFFIPPVADLILSSLLSATQLVFLTVFWYAFIFSYVVLNIITWIFNVGIVTSLRVIDVDYNLIINKEITGSPLEDITDVTSRTTGFIASFFNFGGVFVQTPGAMQNIEFLNVPRPTEAVSIINKLMEGVKHD